MEEGPMTDEERALLCMIRDARRAVEEQAYHSKESLFMLMSRWYPQASESMLDEVVERVL